MKKYMAILPWISSTGSFQDTQGLPMTFPRNSKAVNELEEFFKLSHEDFDTCKPLQWWLGRCAQFPNLYRLACDVFGIPDMFILDYLVFM